MSMDVISQYWDTTLLIHPLHCAAATGRTHLHLMSYPRQNFHLM